MKKIYIYSMVILATFTILPVISHAAESAPVNNNPNQVVPPMQDPGQVRPGTNMPRPPMMQKPPIRMDDNGGGEGRMGISNRGPMGSTTASTTMRARILGDYEKQKQNIQNNQNIRNTRLEDRRELRDGMMASTSSSTMPFRPRMNRFDGEASTTMMRGEDDNRRDIRDMPRGQFIRFEIGHVGNNLHVALRNLQQVRGRINNAINAAAAKGKDMTTAKTDLALADAKIALAAKAVADFDALASSTQEAIDQTGDVSNALPNLTGPRQALLNAQKALKDAREALGVVVRDLAKALGVGLSDNASSTKPESEDNH